MLKKFESFLKRLQSGINKGVDGELIASKIKEVKLKKEKEVEAIFLTFETKEDVETVIPTFAIK